MSTYEHYMSHTSQTFVHILAGGMPPNRQKDKLLYFYHFLLVCLFCFVLFVCLFVCFNVSSLTKRTFHKNMHLVLSNKNKFYKKFFSTLCVFKKKKNVTVNSASDLFFCFLIFDTVFNIYFNSEKK